MSEWYEGQIIDERFRIISVIEGGQAFLLQHLDDQYGGFRVSRKRLGRLAAGIA